MNIPFIDLQAQQRRLGDTVQEAIDKVLSHGSFILGPEVEKLENRLTAEFGGFKCVSCGNGTDALILALMALDIGPGDAVIVPAFSFIATSEAIVLVGATPVFIDVDETTFNIDPAGITEAIQLAQHEGLNVRCIVTVDMFGQPADYETIQGIASTHELMVVADAAHSVGAIFNGRPVTTLADITTVSFFPSKPLGCYGDGGATFTRDPVIAEKIQSLRVHGKGKDKYENVRIGMNSRLDTIQAAVLLAKMEIFPEEIAARNRIADVYQKGLANVVATPGIRSGSQSTWAQYTIRSSHRQTIIDACAAEGIPTAIYYPAPLNEQPAYRNYPTIPHGTPRAHKLAATSLSLPMHPYLDMNTQTKIIETVTEAVSCI